MCTCSACVLHMHSFVFPGHVICHTYACHMGAAESTQAAVCAAWCGLGTVGAACMRVVCVGLHMSSACVRARRTHGPLHTDVFQSGV